MPRSKKTNKVHVNFLFNNGGLGDNIARLPAIEYILKEYPNTIPHVWVPDYFKEFTKRSLSKGAIIRSYSEQDKYRQDFPSRLADAQVHTNLSYHMTDHAFNMLVNQQVSNIYKDYLPVQVDDIDISKFDLPEKYVVLCTGFTAPAREFVPSSINAICDYLNSKGFTPVFLGKSETPTGVQHIIKGTFKEEIDYSKGINLIDNTTLLETTKIITQAKTIVGVDNGLLHIACTNSKMPVIGGFTNVLPEHRMAYRNGGILGSNYYPVTPPKEADCCACQSTQIFEFNHSFTKCVYDNTVCIDSLTPDLFIKELEKIL